MTQSLNNLLANAVSECAVANDLLTHKRQLLSQASNAERDAVNKVNEAQKAFDDLVALVKKEAPRGTDWKDRTLPRYPVPNREDGM